MPRIEPWTSPEKELNMRLGYAQDSRKYFQYTWEENEKIVYNTKGRGSFGNTNLSFSFDSDVSGLSGVDNSDEFMGVNYTFKNLRFIHAQLSANPPSVVPRPTSNDPEDRRKADAADRIIRYAMRQYSIQEEVDRLTLNALLYGTGFIKILWDPEAGELLDLDMESGEMTMTGDVRITVPQVWDMFLDPDAEKWEDVRYLFQRIVLPYEEACRRWPEKKALLEQMRTKGEDYSSANLGRDSALRRPKYDVVELFEYWEKGLPVNGFLGRYCICTKSGQLISELTENPERYSAPRKKGEARQLPIAVLPYISLTDVDSPGNVWGRSFVEFTAGLQDSLNKLDSVILENIQAHGVARIILPEGAEIQDDSITNSPWDIVKITGTQPPHFMEPMPLPPSMSELRDRLRLGIDDMSGVNEAMFGQQSREQSGFSMQYATNQGNMIRRRLFNKYVLAVEQLYKAVLNIARSKWKLPRTIEVLGKEKAFEAIDVKGADIDGGFDLVVEYGASLSLDPTTRREEILTLMPLFEKAGVDTRQILSMLKLNELSNMYDIIELAKDRQREIFEEMLATGLYIPPEELQDHKNMLTYSYYYLMTTEFKYLEEEQKALVRRHVREREQLAAQQAAGVLGSPSGPGPLPQGPAGAPPSAAGMQAGPVDVSQLGAVLGQG